MATSYTGRSKSRKTKRSQSWLYGGAKGAQRKQVRNQQTKLKSRSKQ